MTETLDRNRQTIRAHFAALEAGHEAAFAETHAAYGRNHAPAPFDLGPYPPEGKPFGPAEARETLARLRSTWRDMQVRIEELVSEDDQVVAWVRMTGTTRDGRPIDVRHAHRFRLHDGRIIEHWAVRDDLRAMLQAGVIKPPGPA